MHVSRKQKMIFLFEYLLPLRPSSVDVDEFVSWLEQTCSSMDHLQWMGAVRIRVQTADKTSQ